MSRTLRIGGLLPNVGAAASPEAITEFAVACEELGVHSLWVGDHLLLPETQLARYPYNESGDYLVPSERNYLEAFTTLAWVAGQTRRIHLGVSVAIAPYRHRVQTAKVLGTIEFLAPGRMILGVGTGWLKDEFDALGVPFERRNADTVGLIRFLREAGAAEGAVPVQNEGYDSHRVFIRPGPTAGLPIWVGGNGPLARKRAARLGDAWHPALTGQSPAQLAREFDEVKALARDLGRDPDGIELTVFAQVTLADTMRDQPWSRGNLRGPAPALVKLLGDYADAGVSEVILSIGGSVGRRLATIRALAEAGLPLAAG
ncbi:MAG: TIGR03619 family F420-dependent LLM class oxidoreductase [Acidimicrobiales bacterium]